MATREVALFLLTAFNAVSDQWSAFCNGVNKVATGFWHFFTGTTNIWYFLPHAAVPIPASYYANYGHGLETPDTLRLQYDTHQGLLTYRPRRTAEARTIQQLPWLSTTLSVNGRIFNMDTWTQGFRFNMLREDGGWFTPRTLISCWSIDTKLWPTSTDNTFLNVIDHEGTPYQFSVFGEYDEDEWLRCLGDVDSGEEEDVAPVAAVADAGADADDEEEEESDEEGVSDEENEQENAPAPSLHVSPVSETADITPAEAAAEAVPEAVTEAVTEAPVTEATAEATAEAAPPLIIEGVSEWQRSLGAEAPAPAPADVPTAEVAVVMATVMAEID
jgi:hypothetical protein